VYQIIAPMMTVLWFACLFYDVSDITLAVVTHAMEVTIFKLNGVIVNCLICSLHVHFIS